jgi:cytochrome P450
VAEAELSELPSASLRQSVRFTLTAMLPNLIQGLFRRRPRAVAAATRLDVDGRAVKAIDEIRHSDGPGPVWVRAGGDRMLLTLATEDVRRVLEGSPQPFAPDPDAKRRGMGHFQPDALTLSRGELWRNRRRFAESVLDTGRPRHRFADRFAAVTDEEAAALLRELDSGSDPLGWDAFQRCGWRLTRRIVLGDAARDDEELTRLLATLMDEGNKLPKDGEPSELLEPFLTRVSGYISAAEPGSLVALVGEAPSDDDTRTERQVTHWLFAMGDTLFANAYRALALLATHSRQRERAMADSEYLAACLQEAMRLWPTTPLLSRESLAQTTWDGGIAPAGTQLLISNVFNHRDLERHPGANRFNPEAWTEGDRAEDWSLNHFSHGPQSCPGADLALFLGTSLLAGLLAQRTPRLLEPKLDPNRPLPHMLDFFALRFELEPGG